MATANRQGSVLVLCLGILTILALISAAFVSSVQLYQDAGRSTQAGVIVRRGLLKGYREAFVALDSAQMPLSATFTPLGAGNGFFLDAGSWSELPLTGGWNEVTGVSWSEKLGPTGPLKLYWRARVRKWAADVDAPLNTADANNPDLNGDSNREDWPDINDNANGFYHVQVESRLANGGAFGPVVASGTMDFAVHVTALPAAGGAAVLWRRMGAVLPES